MTIHSYTVVTLIGGHADQNG